MKVILTSPIDDPSVKCQFCTKVIASLVDGVMIPSAAKCYHSGNVPVPNFGWFCSQDCAEKYEMKEDVRFSRNKDGEIDYYNTSF